MPKFLVFYEESFEQDELRIVNAVSADEAIEKYRQTVAIEDDHLLEYIYDRSTNMGIASRFWFTTAEESEALEERGEVIATNDEFGRRIREFFADTPDYADLYLQYYWNEEYDENPPPDNLFPKQMIERFIDDDWSPIIAIAIDEIQEI